jgi:WD40 repeat protein
VRDQILHAWEAQDVPPHLRTIRDRLLAGDERHRGRLLGLVQAIQEKGSIPAEPSPEQMQLRLTGLVVPREGRLQIYNPIYAAVFTPAWVRAQLQELRPPIYATAISAWEAAPPDDRPRHLIAGAPLQEALAWAKGKTLSPADEEFLGTSESAERQAQSDLRDARHRRWLITGLSTGLAVLSLLSLVAWHQMRLAQWREQAALVLGEAPTSPVEALIRALALSQRPRGLTGQALAQAGADPLALALSETIGWGESDRLVGHHGGVMAVAFRPDGQRFVSASTDHTLRLWNLRTGDPIGAPLRGHTGLVRAVAFSPDGRRLVSGSQDHTLRLWDAASGQPLGPPLRGHTDWKTVLFSPDGQVVYSGSSDGSVWRWRVATAQPILPPLQGHDDVVNAVAISADGRRLATGSGDSTLRIWDTRTGQALTPPLIGHAAAVRAAAFLPGGRQLISASTDNTLRIWDAFTGQPLRADVQFHQDEINAMAFNRDGSHFASVTGGSQVRLWEHSASTNLRLACQRLHRHHLFLHPELFGHQLHPETFRASHDLLANARLARKACGV